MIRLDRKNELIELVGVTGPALLLQAGSDAKGLFNEDEEPHFLGNRR